MATPRLNSSVGASMTKLISVLSAFLAVSGCISGRGAEVPLTKLLASPSSYDNEHIRTFGYVVLGGGMCTLVAHGEPSRSGHAVMNEASVWLSSSNALCAASARTMTCATVSGIFTVLKPRDGKPQAYVLRQTHMELKPAGCSAQVPSNLPG